MENILDGRTLDGRFALGNKGGPGNPYAQQTAAFRAMLAELITEEDLKDIIRALIKKAKDGYFPAIKLVLERLIGLPKNGGGLAAFMPPMPLETPFGNGGNCMCQGSEGGEVAAQKPPEPLKTPFGNGRPESKQGRQDACATKTPFGNGRPESKQGRQDACATKTPFGNGRPESAGGQTPLKTPFGNGRPESAGGQTPLKTPFGDGGNGGNGGNGKGQVPENKVQSEQAAGLKHPVPLKTP